MRITIPQPQLLKTLQVVERAVSDRTTLPILSNVLVEIKQHELVLTATDLDVGIQCRFPLVPPIEEGAVALPARKLTTIVRELPEEPVTLEAKKNNTATVNCGTSLFRLPGLPPEDFPVLPQPDATQELALPQSALKFLITQTAHAMSMEETRFILNGALLTAQRQSLVMAATDGRRLAVATTPLSRAPTQPFEAIIPSKTIRELGRLLQDDEEDATISPLKDNQVAVRFGTVSIITRLIEGQFPPYEKVIPGPTKSILVCGRAALLNAIRRASLMTTAASQAVLFEIGASQLVISKESPETGSAREEIPATYSGDPMRVAFNPEFWVDVLKVLTQDEVSVELSGPDRPAVIRQSDFTYVVLPMKIA